VYAAPSSQLNANAIAPSDRPTTNKTNPTRIADGPLSVELRRSLETDLPGVPFGVTAGAFSNEDDEAVNGTAIRVNMAPSNARWGGACVGGRGGRGGGGVAGCFEADRDDW
jgi:hypothetical protein